MQTIRLFSSDIEMKFGISECDMLEMKRGKNVQKEELELPSGETIKSLENGKRC